MMDEIAALTPDTPASHERLGRRGLQWPVAADGTDIADPLRASVRPARAARGRFAAAALQAARRRADDEFPLILVTGRRARALQRRAR